MCTKRVENDQKYMLKLIKTDKNGHESLKIVEKWSNAQKLS
jgi:hypothetical protein